MASLLATVTLSLKHLHGLTSSKSSVLSSQHFLPHLNIKEWATERTLPQRPAAQTQRWTVTSLHRPLALSGGTSQSTPF